MAHAENSVTIGRPVKIVYDFVLNGANSPLWRPSVTDVSLQPGKALGAGAVFKQGLTGPGGRRIDGDYQIVEAKPESSIRFQVIAGPARPEGRYTFEPDGKATKISFALDFKPKGLAKLIDGMITESMQEEVGMLSNLKEFLESHT